MADANREILFTLRTTADLQGAQALDAQFQKSAQSVESYAEIMGVLKTSLLEQAKATGASAEQITAFSEYLDQHTAALDRADEAVAKDTQTIGEAQKAWAAHAGGVEHGSERIERGVSKSMGLTQERIKQASGALAGFVTQAVAGADATQLFTSGLASSTAMLATAGPWGIAIGAAIQAIGTFAIKQHQAAEEAEKAAQKQEDALRRMIEQRRNAGIAEDEWRINYEKGTKVIEARIEAMREENKLSEEATRRRNEERASQNEVAKSEDAEKVRAGTMTKFEADERERQRQRDDLREKGRQELEAIARRRAEAVGAEKAAQERQGLTSVAEQEAQKRYDEAKRAERLDDLLRDRKSNIPKLDQEIDRYEVINQNAATPESTAELQRLRRERDSLQREIQTAEAERKKLGRFDESGGVVDVAEYGRQLDQAKKQTEAEREKSAQDAAKARQAIEREDANYGAATQNQRRAADVQEAKFQRERGDQLPKAAEAAQRQVDDGVDKAKQILEEMGAKLRSMNSGLAGETDKLLAMLADGTNAEEMSRIAAAVQQINGLMSGAFNSAAIMFANQNQILQGVLQQFDQLKAQTEDLKKRAKGLQ